MLRHHTCTVRVPATSANMGPGFDCLGLAVHIFNDVTVTAADHFSMVIEGEGADTLPAVDTNLVCQGVALAFKAAGWPAVPPLAYRLVNRIPISAGLGSS